MRQHRLPSLLPPLLSPGLCSKEEEKEEDEDEDETTLMLATTTTTTRWRSRAWFRAGVNGVGGSADCGREDGVDPRRLGPYRAIYGVHEPPWRRRPCINPRTAHTPRSLRTSCSSFVCNESALPSRLTTDDFFPSCGGGHLSVKKSCRTFS
jgi:hypothetical protein